MAIGFSFDLFELARPSRHLYRYLQPRTGREIVQFPEFDFPINPLFRPGVCRRIFSGLACLPLATRWSIKGLGWHSWPRSVTMLDHASFHDLIRRVGSGDQNAAAVLVRHYEPEIRRDLRLRLQDSPLHRILDSIDISQSVLANFFVRAAAGQFDLATPEKLLKLLMKMAHNKLRDHARRQHACRRDHRRVQTSDSSAMAAVPAHIETPSKILEGREMLDAVHRCLSAEERYLAEQRELGLGLGRPGC